MSWDIFLFNLKTRINTFEEISDELLIPTDFCKVFEQHFKDIKKDDNHRRIIDEDFSIEYFLDDEPVSHMMMSLYGEKAIYAIVDLAKKNNWQVYDTGLGTLIDLDNPGKSGYEDFQNYLEQIKNTRE